jgi:hypothetical protein
LLFQAHNNFGNNGIEFFSKIQEKNMKLSPLKNFNSDDGNLENIVKENSGLR